MKKLKDLLNESVEMGRVYSNPFATAFVKESEEPTNDKTEMTEEQKQAFYEAVKQYRRYGEAVYRNAGLSEVYEAIKNMVEVAGKVTLSETGDWFDNVTVGRHMKRMGESFRVFEKTLKEVSTLQQRLEASYDEIGEVLGKYYEISELNEIEEGNEFGSARAKAIANGDSEFEVDGKTYKVTNVDKEDKENAEKFANESMKLTDMIKKPSITESNTEYLHIIQNGNDVEYLHSKHDNPNLGGQLYPEKHAKRMMKRPNINVLNWSGTHGKYVRESVNEETHIPDETIFKMRNGKFVHIDDRFGDKYYVTIYGSKGYDYGKEKELSLKDIKNKIKSGEWKEVKESVNEEQLDEKLITFSNRAPYGQVVFMAGGAGSGKGFAIKNFIDSAGFKVRDVDDMKKSIAELDKIGKFSIDKWYEKYSKNLKPEEREHVEEFVLGKGWSIADIANPDHKSGGLKNPNNVASLHYIVDAMGLKDSWLVNMLSGKTNKETLPNLLFDITAKKSKFYFRCN